MRGGAPVVYLVEFLAKGSSSHPRGCSGDARSLGPVQRVVPARAGVLRRSSRAGARGAPVIDRGGAADEGRSRTRGGAPSAAMPVRDFIRSSRTRGVLAGAERRTVLASCRPLARDAPCRVLRAARVVPHARGCFRELDVVHAGRHLVPAGAGYSAACETAARRLKVVPAGAGGLGNSAGRQFGRRAVPAHAGVLSRRPQFRCRRRRRLRIRGGLLPPPGARPHPGLCRPRRVEVLRGSGSGVRATSGRPRKRRSAPMARQWPGLMPYPPAYAGCSGRAECGFQYGDVVPALAGVLRASRYRRSATSRRPPTRGVLRAHGVGPGGRGRPCLRRGIPIAPTSDATAAANRDPAVPVPVP
jgi:hypothetical protein